MTVLRVYTTAFVLQNTMLLVLLRLFEIIYKVNGTCISAFGYTAIVIKPKDSLKLVFGLHAIMRSNPRNNALTSISF